MDSSDFYSILHLNRVYDIDGNIIYGGLNASSRSNKIPETNNTTDIRLLKHNIIVSGNGNIDLNIYSISGGKVLSANGSDNISADVSSLTPGVYIARATTADRQITSLKFTR